MKRFVPVVTAVLLYLLISCSTPPSDALTVPLFGSLVDFMSSEETPGGLRDLFFSFRSLAGTDNLISSLYEGDILLMEGRETAPLENTLAYTTGGNSLVIHRDLFVTSDKSRKLYYSLDGQVWYAAKNHQRKGISNISYSYPMEADYDRDGGRLHIAYVWIVGKSPLAEPVKMKAKPLVELSETMVFYSEDDELNTIDLSRNFIKIPGGTRVRYYVDFTGNLVNNRIAEGLHQLEVQRDFHIYTSNESDLKMGISLDGLSWNFNPFRFKFKIHEFFICTGPGELEYRRNMDIIYRI